MRKLADDRLSYGDNSRLTTKNVYEQIQLSNSSLRRRNKKQLEDSIERVLDVLRSENAEDDEDVLDGDFEGLDDAQVAANAVVVRSTCSLSQDSIH